MYNFDKLLILKQTNSQMISFQRLTYLKLQEWVAKFAREEPESFELFDEFLTQLRDARRHIPDGALYVAVDVDSTIFRDNYPKIGEPLKFAIPVLLALRVSGINIILNTMRQSSLIQELIERLNEEYIDVLIENPNQASWTDSPKVYAHIYIDDSALGMRLTVDNNVSWVYVMKELPKAIEHASRYKMKLIPVEEAEKKLGKSLKVKPIAETPPVPEEQKEDKSIKLGLDKLNIINLTELANNTGIQWERLFPSMQEISKQPFCDKSIMDDIAFGTDVNGRFTTVVIGSEPTMHRPLFVVYVLKATDNYLLCLLSPSGTIVHRRICFDIETLVNQIRSYLNERK